MLVCGRGPVRAGSSGGPDISATEPEQLDRDAVRVAEHHQRVRRGLRALEQCPVFDADGVEVLDPFVDLRPAVDLQREVVQPCAQLAEYLSIRAGMVVKAKEQPGAGTAHHDCVANPGAVRFDEGSDQPQNPGVPGLTGGDVADREADVVKPGHRWDGPVRFLQFDNGGHGQPPRRSYRLVMRYAVS